MDMDEFTRGYVGCALWLSDENPPPGPWDHLFDEFFARLDPKSLAAMVEGCRKFQSQNESALLLAYEISGYEPANAGHDFWLTRNHHGSGFWSRTGLDEIGETLTKAAHECGERDLYTGDDDKIYQMGSE